MSQSNNVGSSATAANLNGLEQGAIQAQRGGDCRCGSNGIQAIGQNASNTQGAFAGSLAVQEFGRDKCGCGSGGNSNAPVRVDSEGDGGSVDQSNNVWSSGTAANLNGLGQGASQAQGGSGGIQAIGQDASNYQTAAGLSARCRWRLEQQLAGAGRQRRRRRRRLAVEQRRFPRDWAERQPDRPVGGADPGGQLRLFRRDRHPGDRPAGVERAGRCGALVRASGGCEQRQHPGERGQRRRRRLGRPVEQRLVVGHRCEPERARSERDSGSGRRRRDAIQAIGQSHRQQAALALSAALQFGASNSNSPVAVDSEGDAGDVSQSNNVYSAAKALNLNLTGQGAEQTQSGRCGCGNAVAIQAIGQQGGELAGRWARRWRAANPTNRRQPV